MIENQQESDRKQASKRIRWVLAGILCLGLLIRLLHFWAIAGTALPKHHLTATEADDYAFFQWAQRILAGDWLGRDTYHPYFDWMREIAPLETWYRWWGGKEIFHQAPLYPYLLAGLLALFRESVPWVLLAQLLIGAIQPLIMYRLGAMLFEPRVGLIAAAVTALYGPFIFHQGVLLRDWLSPILEPLALLALLVARRRGLGWNWVVVGAALGLALLTKETVLLLIPLVLLWIIINHGGAWRQAATATSWVLIGLILTLSPLLLRNAVVGAPLFALSNRITEVFAIQNKADTSSWQASLPDILERSQGRPSSGTLETVKTYQGDLLQFVKRQLWKLNAIRDPIEIPNNVSFSYGLELSPALRWTLGYSFVFPLGLAGLLVSLRAWRRHSLVFLYGLAAVAGLMATYPIARYRLVLVPVLILCAAAILIHLVVSIQERRTIFAIGIIGLVLGCFLIQRSFQPLAVEEADVYSLDYLASAQVYADEKEFARAAAEVAHLVDKLPHSPQAAARVPLYESLYWVLLAHDLMQQGEKEMAREHIDRSLMAYARYRGQGGQEAYPLYNLGMLYVALDRPAEARIFFERFLTLDPTSARADRVRRLLSP